MMKALIPVIALVSMGALASGCYVQEQIFGERGDFVRGRVSFGFEEAGFRPCGSDEQWWIVGSDDNINELQQKWNDLGLPWYEHGYAEVKGERTSKGEYGHLGAYDRELDVKDILEVRLLKEGECQWPKTER